MSRLVALITDFGTQDVYAGVMKGVMHSICPEIKFIDITHAIHHQSVREGALALRNSYKYFPSGTVFLVVVDPGVGSARRPVMVEAGGYIFVAPDNGILSYVLAETEGFRAVELTNPHYQLEQVSHTFHGRDIFAPAAAYAACDEIDLSDFGDEVLDLAYLQDPQIHIEVGHISGEVTNIDHFGNIITSIGPLQWVGDGKVVLKHENYTIRITADDAWVSVHGHTVRGILHAYHEALRGELLAQVDSNGFLELAINQDNAAARVDAMIGDHVDVKYRSATGSLTSD